MNNVSANGTEPTGLAGPAIRPDSLENDDRPLAARSPLDAPPPSSAPPYPYEGDLDDARHDPPAGQQRAAVPLERPTRPIFPAVRPATPGGRRTDWVAPESARTDSARHALEPPTPRDGTPRINPPAPVDDRGTSADVSPARSSYDPVSFPRRLRYEPAEPAGSVPPADPPAGYAAPTAYPGFPGLSTGDPGGTPTGDEIARALPQRVPAEPDVPTVPEPPSVEPPAETPALARIATHLRRDDVLSPTQERQEGFDVQAILAAVREVEGVRDASLRSTPAGAHSLRLDLAEGADPAEVSRHVARLLQDRMGLDAAMQGDGGATAAPPLPTAPASDAPVTPFVPSQAGPGRAPTGSAPVAGDDLRSLPTSPQAGRPGPPRPLEPETRPEPPEARPAAESESRFAPRPAEPESRFAPRPAEPESRFAPRPAEPESRFASRPAEPESRFAPRPVESESRFAPRPVESESRFAPAEPRPAEPESRFAPAVPESPPATPGGPIAPGAGMSSGAASEQTATPCAPPRPLDPGDQPGPRVVIDNVQVNTFGNEATVEVRLSAGGRSQSGVATGPAFDGYVLRLCAMATAKALDELLATSTHDDGPARCFVEHAAAVPFGSVQVAVVVVLLSCEGWVEQLSGSAVVADDDRHAAMVRATLAAVNRRLEALLS